MARRNQHSREELRGLAIQAVRDLVVEHGLEKLSVRKVADRIGYTAGMLYHVFSNLDDLILNANADTLAQLLDAMTEPADRSARDQLHHMAAVYVAMAREQTALWKMVFMHQMQNAAEVPGWYLEKTAALFARVEHSMAQLAGGQSHEQIHLAARTLWGSVHGIAVLAADDKLVVAGDVNEQAMIESLLQHYLNSWAGE
ncbi:MAG: TetR/AcrR family transcriptional regulator [Alcanivorax sediminis]|uniref:TetR family transcriptional regulator n=1 Tax=Alcanivorax sediminis TaxID=2663008 RepID=A0A6N7LQ85_9GAMM|nr:TetR family transcriptional regulator [Alcanivorax sediminis]